MPFYFSYNASSLYKHLSNSLKPEILLQLYSLEKLHCTMLYNSNPYQEIYKNLIINDCTTHIVNIEKWQTDKDWVVVATLENSILKEHHNFIKTKFNLHTLLPFVPHVTLQRTKIEKNLIPKESLLFLINKKIKLNNFTLQSVMHRPSGR